MEKLKSVIEYLKTFFKWVVIATVIGLIGGLVGTLFHISVYFVTETRIHHSWLIYLLPLGGLLLVGITKLCRSDGVMNTNIVLDCVRIDKKVPALMAPLIFISTVITHFFGGSAGREGAALQIGGSLGYRVGRLFRLNDPDMRLVVIAGMSAVFTALFGTPLTATVFAIEVVSVGVMYYVALLPCVIASFCAYMVANAFNVPPVHFEIAAFPEISVVIMVKAIVLAVICAIVSILFCLTIKKTEKLAEKYFPNDFVRILAGGAILVLLTIALRTYDYNGAGMDIIERAIGGEAKPEAFILKIIFTAITIAAGFKGGEIVPTFFIGSTLGCVAGSLLGLDPGIGAAIGFVALFCGVVNCPVASILLAVEVFGAADWALVFLAVCAVSYMMSGYTSLYKSQRIMYSKTEAKYINAHTK